MYGLDNVGAVLLGDTQWGLQFNYIAMYAICQYNDLVVQQHTV